MRSLAGALIYSQTEDIHKRGYLDTRDTPGMYLSRGKTLWGYRKNTTMEKTHYAVDKEEALEEIKPTNILIL